MCSFDPIGFKLGVALDIYYIIMYIHSKMKMEIVISESKKPDKQFDARTDNKTAVSFGQKGASDYTKHKDKERQDAYVDRHKT